MKLNSAILPIMIVYIDRMPPPHRDYLLLHDKDFNKAGIDLIIELSKWDMKAGGKVVYKLKEEDIVLTPSQNK